MYKRENEVIQTNIFNRFKELYLDFPVGESNPQESPDFIVKTILGETIGMEITEAIYSKKHMSTSQYQIEFNEIVLEILEPKLPFKFDITVHLTKKHKIKKVKRIDIANKVAEICVNEFLNLSDLDVWSIYNFNSDIEDFPPAVQKQILANGYRNLPKGINSIRLGRFDILDRSCQHYYKGGAVPIFNKEHLNNILTDKHKRLKKYKKCDQHWLIIGEGDDFYSYYKNIDINTPIISDFDKVFIVRTFPRLVIVLKD